MTGQPGRSGRKPKPAAIKRLEGNRGKRPIRNEPIAKGQPVPPAHLSAEQRVIWFRLMNTMPAGVIAACDEVMLEMYCVAVDTFRQADELIDRSALLVGNAESSKMQNPLLRIRSRSAAEARACAIELGLSPASRAKLPQAQIENDDPMTLLLGMDDEDDNRWATRRPS